MESSLYKPVEVAHTCHSTLRRLKYEDRRKFKTSLGYRVCLGHSEFRTNKLSPTVHCVPSLKKQFCFACLFMLIYSFCMWVCIYVGVVLPQVNAEVRRQLVAVIFLLPIYGFQGSNSGRQSWRQTPLPTRQSR